MTARTLARYALAGTIGAAVCWAAVWVAKLAAVALVVGVGEGRP